MCDKETGVAVSNVTEEVGYMFLCTCRLNDFHCITVSDQCLTSVRPYYMISRQSNFHRRVNSENS